MPQAEWVSRHRFAEVAEALHVTTDQIVAAIAQDDRGVTVLFSADPDPTPTTKLSSARLERSDDDLLSVAEVWQLDADLSELVEVMGEAG